MTLKRGTKNGGVVTSLGQSESIEELLELLGLSCFEDLFIEPPESAREYLARSSSETNGKVKFPAQTTEFGEDSPIYSGAGGYDRLLPASVEKMVGECDLYMAYSADRERPRLAVLRAFEAYRRAALELAGMEAASGAVFCGGSALAYGCLLACEATGRTGIVVSETLDPSQRSILAAYAAAGLLRLYEVPERGGLTDLAALDALLSERGEEIAATVAQYPNFYGNLERMAALESAAHARGAAVVMSVELVTLAAIKSPAEWGADIVVSDSAPTPDRNAFEKGRLGVIAVSERILGSLPDRVAFVNDADGVRPVLILQRRGGSPAARTAITRSREALTATAALAYYAYTSPESFERAAFNSYRAAKYARERLIEAGFPLLFDAPCLHEFAVSVADPAGMNAYLRKWGIVGGCELPNALLFAFTEKRAKGEIDELVHFMKLYQFGDGGGTGAQARA